MSGFQNCADELAIALGNPARSQVLAIYDRNKGAKHRLIMNGFQIEGCAAPPGMEETETADGGQTYFLYKADKERYESGYHITVKYYWNDDEKKDCVENQVLREKGHIPLSTFRTKILKKIKILQPVTLIEIVTIEGRIKVFNLRRKIPKQKAYRPIPESLSAVPRVPISSLRICPTGTMSNGIDIVTRFEDLGPTRPWYAFKRYEIPIERQPNNMDQLLSEVEILCRVDSPYIMKPSFIVTDASGSLFRGYLMPFIPAGSLFYVFEELRREGPGTNWREPMFMHPTHLKHLVRSDKFTEDGRRVDLAKPTTPQLPWHVKHTWAIEATNALVALHASAIYSGDVKLHNILLNREGHLQLIDVAPQRGYTEGYVAPELDPTTGNLSQTEARDIFAFGIVLWQIAEEEGNVKSGNTSASTDLDWRPLEVEGSTPKWYRDLVRRCVDCDPSNRPSATDLLTVLESEQEVVKKI